MHCASKLNLDGRQVACGQCMNCRINRKRLWTGRILLEATHSHNGSTFVTLTYNDINHPQDGSVSRDDLSGFINRLRHKKGIGHFRFFAVGEYGDKTQRPHYHLAIFNNPPELLEKPITETWEYGFNQLGEIEKASASYIAGYTTKKMTKKGDDRLEGREPEFATMSRNPPLGAAGMHHIYDLLHTRSGSLAVQQYEDVPSSFRIQGKTYPIGKYWKTWLRNQMGIENPPINSPWDIDYEQAIAENNRAQKVCAKLWGAQNRRTINAV